jgi:hypothetical protein
MAKEQLHFVAIRMYPGSGEIKIEFFDTPRELQKVMAQGQDGVAPISLVGHFVDDALFARSMAELGGAVRQAVDARRRSAKIRIVQ